MALKQNDLNWFRPLWRRVAIVVFLTAWLAWEVIWTKETMWMVLVGAALAYSIYNFFVAFPKDEAAPPAPTTEEQDQNEERPKV